MKHTLGKRLLSLALVLVMVLSLLPAEPFHVHAAETESAKTTKKVTDEDTRLEIDYDKPFYKVDADGNPVYDKNGQLIYLEPEQALAEEAESHRSSVSTYSGGQPMDHDYYWSYDNRDPWRQIYKGDGKELRQWMESKDPDDGRIVLIEDIKITLEGDKNWEPIKITRDKVLDLNGKTLEFYDKRNGTKDQSNNDEHHQFYAFEIAEGAQLTIIDSKGAAIMTKDEKGEYVASNTFSGRIYANGYMINHQKWDLWYYTHRDIFRVTDGDLVIYGGEFQAGRQKDQVKTNFSWNKLKTVIGDAVTLGTSIYEYATGIAAAHAAKEDMGNKDPNANAKEEEKKNEDSETDNGKTNNGKTNKKDGTGGTEEKKTDTPASVGNKGDKSQQKDQTVAQKQTENNKKEDDKKKGDKGTDNKADDKKAAKKEPTASQLVEANKTIAQAYLNKDKITDMVDKAITFGENLYELFGSDESSRATACIQGTVARIGNNSTLVIYDGDFVGHGSTPNVRNAVIEVSHSEILNGISSVNSPLNGKTNGGLVYVYGGTFSGYAGANVFNMYKTNNKLTTVMYEVVTEEVIDPETGMLRYESKKTAIPKQLAKSETFGIEEVRYEKQDHWKNADLYEQLSEEEKENGPALVNTANIMVRGGNFRTYYEPSMMAVMKPETKGTNRNDGQYCPTHDADDGESESYGDECECDDQEHFKFSGTPGTVNLGVESYGEDMIKDGRIQIVDVYGQGNLVLLDGGDPIDHDPNGKEPVEDTYTGSVPENTYTTEGGFRHYRLFISDTELRGMNYLSVYPNTALTNSTFSFSLQTYWGDGLKTAEGWASDEGNYRAPYSSNEKYVEFEYDDMDTSDGNSGGAYGVSIIPNLNMTNPFAAGEELAQSNVWYYNIPVNAKGESMSIPYADNYVYGTYNGKEYKISYNRLRKEGDGWDNSEFNNANAWNGRLRNRTYEKVTDESYLTNIKFFTYKVYRVDPLTRENINEGDEWSDNEPLIEVRYGASNQSLKCKITLKTLEKEIAEKLGDPNWSFHSGELYRVEFSVEEHLGYGYEGVQDDGEVIFLNTLSPAKAETSILFRCVEKTEDKLAEHYNPDTGTTTVGEVPDWTPLQFVKQDENGNYYKDEKLVAGEYATVNLINGQPSLVDWRGYRVFDIYYQWYILDDPADTTPTLIAGTDNVWVAQSSGGGKTYHKPDNWVLKDDGSGNGYNDQIYANTIDPNSAEAAKFTYYPNGLPMDPENPSKSTDLWDYKMLHMYTQETCPAHEGMRKYADVAELDLGNNNPFWGNTDSVYIPNAYAGKYLQCKVVAVNVNYPHLYDNLQTIASHTVKIDGVPIEGFANMAPAVVGNYQYGGHTDLGEMYKSQVPSFSFSALPLSQEYLDKGYKLELSTLDVVDGEVVGTTYDGKPYTPTACGKHVVKLRITAVDQSGVRKNFVEYSYSFDLIFEPNFTKLTPTVTQAELKVGVKNLGNIDRRTFAFEYEPLPQYMVEQGYYQEFVIGTNYGTNRDYSTVSYTENGGTITLHKPFYGYTVTAQIELHQVIGNVDSVVKVTAFTYKLTLAPYGWYTTGMKPAVTEKQLVQSSVDLGVIYDPITISYDPEMKVPEWIESSMGLPTRYMYVYRDGELIASGSGYSYTPSLFGRYEVVIEQDFLAGTSAAAKRTFTYKFQYEAPELKFMDLTPAPTAEELKKGEKDLGTVSAPTTFTFKVPQLSQKQIADDYTISAYANIYDMSGSRVSRVGIPIVNNFAEYAFTMEGEYRVVLELVLRCQPTGPDANGTVTYSESVEFTYKLNQTHDYYLSFRSMSPGATPEELEAGVTELGNVEAGYSFTYRFVSLPQWMYEERYELSTAIDDYVNGQLVGSGDARYNGYPVTAGGDHVIEFVQTLYDPSGNVLQTIKHTFTCTIVPSAADSVVITPNYYPAEVGNALIAGADDWAIITKGATLDLNATVYPSDALQNVKWTSDNTQVATVDANGLITPVGRGKCVITVTDQYGTVSDTFSVHVDVPDSSYTIWVGGVPLSNGQYLASGSTTPTTTKPASGGYAYLSSTTLTLNNFDVGKNACVNVSEYGQYFLSGVMFTKSTGSVTINVTGENDLIPDLPYGNKAGFVTWGTATISGSNRNTCILHGDILTRGVIMHLKGCTLDGVDVFGNNGIQLALDAQAVIFNGNVSAPRQLSLNFCVVNGDATSLTDKTTGGVFTATNNTVFNGSAVKALSVSYTECTHNGGSIYGEKQLELNASDISVDEIWLVGALDANGTPGDYYSGNLVIKDCNVRVRQIIAPTLKYTSTDGSHSFTALNPGATALKVPRGVNISLAGSTAVTFDGTTIEYPDDLIPFDPECYQDYCYVTTNWCDDDFYALKSGQVYMAYNQLADNEKLAQDATEPTTDWPEVGYVWYYDGDLYLNGYNKKSAVMEVYGLPADIIVSSYGETTKNSFGKIFGWNADLRFISYGCSLELSNSANALTARSVYVEGPEIYLTSNNGTALIADEITVRDGILVASGKYAVDGKVDPATHLVMVGSSASALSVWNGTTALKNYQYVTIQHKHNLTHTEAVPHTCTEDGILEHYSCDICGRKYADEACTEEMNSVTDWASWHNYVGGCTTPMVCADCGLYVRDASGEEHVWAEATCREPERCVNCGETRGEPLSEHILENAMGSGVTERKEPSCTEDGKIAGYCMACKTYVEKVIPKLEHNFTDATCATPGTCTVCGEIGFDALTHTLDDGIITTQPGCVTEGVLTRTCSECGATATEPVAATGIHTYADATCTTPRTCTGCGITEGVAAPHNLDAGIVILEPTCTTEGTLKRSCEDCSYTVEEPIAKLPHSFTILISCTIPAQCEHCGAYRGYAMSHTWEAATCTAPKTCSVCNATEGSALGHNWLAATCEHPKICKTCSITEGSALTHSWKAATCTEPKTCTICWQTEGSKLGHTMDGNECTACGYKAVDLKLTTATLRPGSVGLYFTADFTVASGETVVRSGVALSVYNHQPVADGSDPLSLYTKDNTSVIISNILSDKVTDAVNRSRAEMPIYARAYVELADGSYVYSDVVSMNLKQIVEMADTQWSLLSVAQKDAITDMYVKFKNVLDTWNIPNLKAY